MSFKLYSYSQEPTIKNLTIEEAKKLREINHAQNMEHYHEIHGPEYASQFEPDDCWKCGRNIHRCECKNLGYMLAVCLGNCKINTELKKRCSNTNCALNPWFTS